MGRSDQSREDQIKDGTIKLKTPKFPTGAGLASALVARLPIAPGSGQKTPSLAWDCHKEV